MSKKLWFYVSGFFAGIGMCLAGLVTQAQAQWGSYSPEITMARGQIGHTIHNPGMSGKRDNETKLSQASFRILRVAISRCIRAVLSAKAGMPSRIQAERVSGCFPIRVAVHTARMQVRVLHLRIWLVVRTI